MPASIGLMTALRVLQFGQNKMTGTIPPDIAKLAKLTDLNLRNNMMTGDIPIEIFHLTTLGKSPAKLSFVCFDAETLALTYGATA
jgi:hypothetical protein